MAGPAEMEVRNSECVGVVAVVDLLVHRIHLIR